MVLMGPAASSAGPASPEEGVEDVPSDRGPETRSVPELRDRIEGAMAELGQLAQASRGDTDSVKAACVLDKYERGQGIMEIATGELIVLQDSTATREQKAFAAEKLSAAAERLDGLLREARTCSGETGPEDEDDVTKTEQDEPTTIPVADPTQGGAESPVPPPVDDTRPPTVTSPSQ
jgi:hypothetical protein